MTHQTVAKLIMVGKDHTAFAHGAQTLLPQLQCSSLWYTIAAIGSAHRALLSFCAVKARDQAGDS